MARRDLREILMELHHELMAVKMVTPQDRDLLRKLASDIRAITSDATTTPKRYQELRQRLSDGVTAFEVSHPQMSKTLASVIDTLALYNI
jgi:hypothetical protein